MMLTVLRHAAREGPQSEGLPRMLKEFNKFADDYNRRPKPEKRYGTGLPGKAMDIHRFELADFKRVIFEGGNPQTNFATMWGRFLSPSAFW